MAPYSLLQNLFLGAFLIAPALSAPDGWRPKSKGLRVETHVNTGLSANMVSSLIIGSQAAVIVDLPLTIPNADELTAWIKNTTDKPLVAAFSTHFHADHFLSGGALLDAFPGVVYYASDATTAHIKQIAKDQVESSTEFYGADAIVQDTAIPVPYNHSFFALPGDEARPIYLLERVGGDTIDETLFWIPSVSTLIAGDSIFNNDCHAWLADQQTLALTESWLATLDFVGRLKPKTIIPGHSSSTGSFKGTGAAKLSFTKSYVEFFQKNIQNQGPGHFTKQEIMDALVDEFGALNSSAASAFILDASASEFGSGQPSRPSFIDLSIYTDEKALNGWVL